MSDLLKFLNVPWMFCCTKDFPSWYMNLKFLKLTLLILRMFLALIRAASSTKTSSFDFILTEWWHDIESTESTPSLVWSYIRRTCGFWSLVVVDLHFGGKNNSSSWTSSCSWTSSSWYTKALSCPFQSGLLFSSLL